MDKRMLIAGGVLAVAAIIGLQLELEKKPELMTVSQELAVRKVGEEIRALRTPNSETFKAADGKFQTRVYTRPKYFQDAEGDTLRPLDLTVREISDLAKLNPLRTHDFYVDAGPYQASWMNDKPHDYRMDAGNTYIKYQALFGDKGITVITEPSADGMKETIMLSDSTAPNTLRWIVETDGSLVAQADNSFLVRVKDGSTPLRVEKPKAWDTKGAPVMTVASVSGDTLSFRVTMLPGQEYPMIVDPSTTVTAPQDNSFTLYAEDATYATARNAATATDTGPHQFTVGQNVPTGKRVWRSYMNFAIPYMSSCSACSLYLRGATNQSTTDFYVDIYGARSYKSTLTTADFQHFDGYNSGAFSGTMLNVPWNSSSYATWPAWDIIIFNSAGRDSVFAAKGDTLWIAMVSSRDSSLTTPSGDEYVTWYHDTYAPYLSFTYSLPAINSPTQFFMTPIAGSKDSLALSWVNNNSSNIDSLILKTYPDSQRVATLTKTASSARIGGLNPYQKYRWYIRADSAGVYGYSNVDSMWTCQTFKTENFSLINTGHSSNIATAVYDSARGETLADSLGTGSTLLGQSKDASNNFTNMRHYQGVVLPTMNRVQAESLFIYGFSDSSRTDFSIVARSGFWHGATADKAKYYTFSGWQTAMTPYTGTDLITPYSTAGFTTGATLNKIPFTWAGRDTTWKRYAAGDTLRFMLLSSKDVSATAPTQAEYVTITEGSSYLRLTYAPPDSAPNGFTLTSISADSLLATWTDRSYSERGFVIVDAVTGAKVAGTDTTAQDVTSMRIGGLSVNTSYAWTVKAVGGEADYGVDYGFSRQLTIDHTKIDATLYNLPVRVSLNTGNFNFTHTHANGYDISFWNAANDTMLSSFDRELHNKSGSTAEYWVKIPVISSTSDVHFHIRYGKITDISDNANRTAVWDANFVMVQHMADSTTSRTSDATSYGNYGTKKGANEPIEAAGLIGKGQSFDGSNDYINYGSNSSILPAAFTITGWVKVGSKTDQTFISFGGTQPAIYFEYHEYVPNYPFIWMGDGNNRYFASSSLTTLRDGNWHHVAFVMPGNAQSSITSALMFVDGISIEAGTTGSSGVQTAKAFCTIGSRYNTSASYVISGPVDEVRISNVARSAAWIKAEYYTGVDSLLTYGLEIPLTPADSCYTRAATPGKPTVTFPADSLLKFVLSVNGNPGYTEFAVQDSVRGWFVDATAEPETLRTGLLGVWGWRTYAGWGGAGGDTLAGVQPGNFYVIRVKARNGQ